MKRSSRPGALGAALCLAAAALAAAPPALAGWEESYKNGKQAYEEGRPNEAIKNLRAALAEKDEEKANAIKASGMFFEPYLPHFYLGLALFQAKDYKGAVEELNRSEAMKVVTKTKDLHQKLRDTRALAEAAAAAAAPPAAPAPPPPAPPPAQVAQQQPAPSTPASQPPATRETSAPAAPPPAPQKPPDAAPSKSGAAPATPQVMTPSKPPAPAGPDPALTRAIDAAAADIAAAAQLKSRSGPWLDESETSRLDGLVAQIRSASDAATATSKRQELQRAVSDLTSKAAERKRQDEQRALDEEARQAALARNKALKEAMGRAEPTLREAESFAAANRAALGSAESQRLASRIEGLRKAAAPEAVAPAAQSLRAELDALKKAVADRAQQASRLGREQFARGVQAYHEGKYDEAIPALEQAASSLQKDADVQAYLGSSLYKKYLLARAQDAALKSRAEQAFRAAIAARGDYALDPEAFPPKVIAFFKDVSARR